jgi:hypothetical protein
MSAIALATAEPIPMTQTTTDPEITLSQRRGKIARLPRFFRNQLNIRLDDGQEAAEILLWLNDLPEVRQIMGKHFNGSAISPQNLSAWRQGGFHEWLLHRQLLDTASHMRENAEEFHEALICDRWESIPHSVMDYMVAQFSVRFAAIMGQWDGTQDNAQFGTLLKIGQFLLKLQQATYRAEREALQLPILRIKAENEYQSNLEIEAYRDHCDNLRRTQIEKWRAEAKAKKTIKRKTPVRTPRAPAQSSPIKVNQGSRPASTEPPIMENAELAHDNQHPSQTSLPPLASVDSPLKT